MKKRSTLSKYVVLQWSSQALISKLNDIHSCYSSLKPLWWQRKSVGLIFLSYLVTHPENKRFTILDDKAKNGKNEWQNNLWLKCHSITVSTDLLSNKLQCNLHISLACIFQDSILQLLLGPRHAKRAQTTYFVHC